MELCKHRLRARRDNGRANKHDTPLKTLSCRDGKKRLLLHKRYETLHEVPEDKDDISLVLQRHQEQVSRLNSRPARLESTGNKLKHCATPIQKPSHLLTPQKNSQVNPSQKFSRSFVTQGDDDETIASSLEPDTTSSNGDAEEEEEEEDSTFSSSLSSPEIFRKDNSVTCPSAGYKNSTLLDVSYAKSIHMHLSPDLSTIIDASMIPTDGKCEVRRESVTVSANEADSASSDWALRKKSTPKPLKRRSIVYKKKVWFKSPIASEAYKDKAIQAATVTSNTNSSQTSSTDEKLKASADASKAKEISSEDGTFLLKLTKQRPVRSSAARAKFFDFVDDKDKDTFFEKMRERYFRLTSVTLFPFASASERGLKS